MPSNTTPRSACPSVGTILRAADRQVVPCHLSRTTALVGRVWSTYAVKDTETDVWHLEWSPVNGVEVFVRRSDYPDLIRYPWVSELEVISSKDKFVMAKIVE